MPELMVEEPEEEGMFDTSPENEHEYPPKLPKLTPEEERLLKEAEEHPFIED